MSEIAEIIDTLENKIQKLFTKINNLKIKWNLPTYDNVITKMTIQY